ncbi:MAG: FAD-dependent oxidoreductase, partial [Rhodospirillaceae bacterium]|nr:FAD-dependent oxidoreductase [Rhodospirillaceae bacterium]
EPEPLRGEAKADICIVGGGFTGLWTAIHLKQGDPSLDVTLIEKDACGAGASGRNGGFCMTWSSKISTLVKLAGAQEALRLFRASEEAVSSIRSFCAEHDIDCGFRLDGWLWMASNQAQLGAWDAAVETLDKLGTHPFEPLDRAEAQARAGSERYLGGVYEKITATVQPAMLARGLARVARSLGVRIHEATPMTRLDRGAPARIHTPGGVVTAERAVLALNAWACHIPEFRRSVLAVITDMVVTEPAPERLAATGLGHGAAMSDSRMLVNYYRTTVDGRLAWGIGGSGFPWGGAPGEREDGPSKRPGHLASTLRHYYPALADLGIATNWRGPVTRTATGLPFFGHMDGHPNIVYGHGYTGNGVGPCYIGGRILASLARGGTDEWSDCVLAKGPPGRFPPEPFRYVGAHMVRDAVARKERAEDRHRKPNRLDVALAGLAPAGLVPQADETKT